MALKISKKPRTYIPEWNGNRDLPEADQISFQYRTLSIEDVFTVQNKTSINLMGGFKLDQEDSQSVNNYWTMVRWVLEHYVDSVKGIIVDDAELTNPVDVIAVLGTGQMDLLGEVFTQILQESSGKEVEAKNSQSESAPASEDSDGLVESA